MSTAISERSARKQTRNILKVYRAGVSSLLSVHRAQTQQIGNLPSAGGTQLKIVPKAKERKTA
jgi:hypothetical protein